MQIIRNTTQDERIFYIIAKGGVGLIRCTINNRTPNVCFLSNLVVDENSRKQLWGSSILTQALLEAHKAGCDMVNLLVDPNSWMFTWYQKRFDFRPSIMWDGELMLMTKILEK